MNTISQQIFSYIDSFQTLTYGFSHRHRLPIQLISLIATIYISFLFFFRMISKHKRYIAIALIVFANILFLLFGIINYYHWGVTFWEYAVFGPGFILGVDIFYYLGTKYNDNKIMRRLIFALFLICTLIFMESFVLTEILPVNQMRESGLLAFVFLRK